MRRIFHNNLVIPILAVVLTVLLTGPVWAHKINVFASADGRTISGYVYASGGGRLIDIPVQVYEPGGDLLLTTRTNDQGEFTFEAGFKCDHIIKVDTGDGHLASWAVTADELPDDLPSYGAIETDAGDEETPVEKHEVPAKPVIVVNETKPVAQDIREEEEAGRVEESIEETEPETGIQAGEVEVPGDANSGDEIAGSKLAGEVESLRKQVNATRDELRNYESKIRFHEILAGIGFILGITGVSFYFMGLRKKEVNAK